MLGGWCSACRAVSRSRDTPRGQIYPWGKHGDSNLAWAVCLAWPTARWESHSSHKDSGATSFASDAAHLGGFTVLTIRQTVSKLALLCPQAVFIQHRDETFSAFLHRALPCKRIKSEGSVPSK